jgi:hypothetical protein
MSLTDYILDTVLVLLVLRQIKTSRYDRRAVLLPLAIVAVVGHSYLHSIPTAGNDLVLIVGLTTVGVVLGSLSGLTTRVWSDGGRYALVKAGPAAASLWVLGMGSRFAFIWYSSHLGSDAVTRFSIHHDITGSAAWTAALVLMALGEVLSRTGILVLRSRQALGRAPVDTAALVAA